jgi:uncharacterized protein (TIGR02246 family)
MDSQRYSEAPPQRASDDAWFRALPQRMIAAWNRGDGAAFAAGFSEQADFVAFEGAHLEGRGEIAAFHQRVFDGEAKGSRLSGGPKFVRLLRPDVAVLHSVVSVTLPGAAHPTPSRDSMQLFIGTKTAGEWRAEALLNARRLTMEQQLFADGFESLSAPQKQQVRDLVQALQARPAGRH